MRLSDTTVPCAVALRCLGRGALTQKIAEMALNTTTGKHNLGPYRVTSCRPMVQSSLECNVSTHPRDPIKACVGSLMDDPEMPIVRRKKTLVSCHHAEWRHLHGGVQHMMEGDVEKCGYTF